MPAILYCAFLELVHYQDHTHYIANLSQGISYTEYIKLDKSGYTHTGTLQKYIRYARYFWVTTGS